HGTTPDIGRPTALSPVWNFVLPGFFPPRRRQRQQAVAECRRQLLNAFLNCDRTLFLMHEPPQDYDVFGDWQRAGERTWLVPRDFDYEHPLPDIGSLTWGIGDCTALPLQWRYPHPMFFNAAPASCWRG